MSELEREVRELYRRNRRWANGLAYTVPAPDTYPYQWLWDSCFHAIVYSQFDIEQGKQELLSLLSKQFDNGLVPHMIYWERGPAIDIDWGRGQETSTITQPPMLAYAAWRLFQKDQDINFLQKIYRQLFHYYRYLLNERDPHERHLIGIINPDESGEDNSPRFDALLGLSPVHSMKDNLEKRVALVKENIKCDFDAPFCMKNFFWVKDVPFNAIMAENLQALVYIAEKLERSYDAEYFGRERTSLLRGMRELMLEDGLYWSTYGESYQKIKVKTWAIFMPLFARLLEQAEAVKLVETHLANPDEFWTAYPLASVAKTEASFVSDQMWRGSVWPAVNWFVYQGLLNYGFNDLASKLAQATRGLIEQSGFREYFNPETGEGLGARDFTWGGLALDMPETPR